MDALKAMLTRRSIRKYTGEPVPDDTLNALLEAAMSAPSAGNQQPWHFVIITRNDLLEKVPGINPHAAMVCAEPALEKHKGYWVQDCSAATQNILTAAHAMGFGAVWTGVYPNEERVQGFRGLLGLPKGIIPLSLVVVGRPAESKPPSKRYTPSRVHKNGW
jgi:nitroreductase